MDSSPNRTSKGKSNRRAALLALAGVIAAPILMTKLHGAFELYVKTQPFVARSRTAPCSFALLIRRRLGAKSNSG